MSVRRMPLPRQCCSITHSYKDSVDTGNLWKSDTNVEHNKQCRNKNNKDHVGFNKTLCTEYYKKYEHDELPVKDSSDLDDSLNCGESGEGDLISASHLDLDQLEVKIYSKISQELQTNSSFVPSLESNIKLFRTTVQEIFDNFYNSMKDFEQYKKRFEYILSKNKEDSIEEMEDFIKDMIQHIMSSDSSLSNLTSKSIQQSSSEKDDVEMKCDCSVDINQSEYNQPFEGFKATIEAFKNDRYKSDTLSGDNSSSDKSRVYCINLVNSNRCVKIKLINRDLLSEVNIRESNTKDDVTGESASAENIKKLKAKKLELERLNEQSEYQSAEKNIPIKVTNPKKNIHLDQDFTDDDVNKEDMNWSFFYKICNFFCKKLRKTL